MFDMKGNIRGEDSLHDTTYHEFKRRGVSDGKKTRETPYSCLGKIQSEGTGNSRKGVYQIACLKKQVIFTNCSLKHHQIF